MIKQWREPTQADLDAAGEGGIPCRVRWDKFREWICSGRKLLYIHERGCVTSYLIELADGTCTIAPYCEIEAEEPDQTSEPQLPPIGEWQEGPGDVSAYPMPHGTQFVIEEKAFSGQFLVHAEITETELAGRCAVMKYVSGKHGLVDGHADLRYRVTQYPPGVTAPEQAPEPPEERWIVPTQADVVRLGGRAPCRFKDIEDEPWVYGKFLLSALGGKAYPFIINDGASSAEHFKFCEILDPDPLEGEVVEPAESDRGQLVMVRDSDRDRWTPRFLVSKKGNAWEAKDTRHLLSATTFCWNFARRLWPSERRAIEDLKSQVRSSDGGES